MLTDVVVATLILLGSVLMALAALGILKLPDFFLRVAAISKASTLGFLLFLMAAAIGWQSYLIGLKMVAVGFFVFITAPTACHLISRAAYRRKAPMYEQTRRLDVRD